MAGSRSLGIRFGMVLLICACALASSLPLAGCDSDVEAPPQMTPPVAPLEPWFYSVWGGGTDDVYVVGQPGLIYHYNGTAWAQQTSGTDEPLTDVWSPNGGQTFYACGHNGVILINSGGGWSRMDSGTDADLYSVGSFDGTIHVCGRQGELRSNSGNSWHAAPIDIIQRDNNGAATDTLERNEEIGSLTAVAYYGINGSDGTILMEDSCAEGDESCVRWPWELRLVTGGQEWVYAAWSDADLPTNFIGTRGGRAFQLQQDNAGPLFWRELFSPAFDDPIYGIWVDDSATDVWRVFYVTQGGQVVRQEILRDPAAIDPVVSTDTIYQGGLWLLDIWGTAADNLYAVGIDAQILHYYDPAGGDNPDWHLVEIELPDELTKSLTPWPERTLPAVDKFGNPL